MKLLGGTKSKLTKDENGENVPCLELLKQYQFILILSVMMIKKIQELVSQQIFPQNSYILETFDSEFSYIEVWFTDQNSKPLEIRDKMNSNLVIN